MQYSASCRCGKIKVTLVISQPIENFQPRQCDCDFCQSYDLIFISEPEGKLLIVTQTDVIQLKQGCTSIDIAEYLNVSKPSIAKRIHALMQLEVLDQVDTEDKRQKKLILSIKGQQLFAECSDKLDLFEQQLLSPLDQTAQNIMLNTLHQLMDHLQEMKGDPS